MREQYLNILRDRKTGTQEFRKAAQGLSLLIATEVSQKIERESRKGLSVAIVPILRAGLVLLPPFLDLFLGSPVGFYGIKRDLETALPVLYYENVPSLEGIDRVLILDPMVATGGSAHFAIEKIVQKGVDPKNIYLISVIASRPGLLWVKGKHPTIQIYSAAVDEGLDGKKYIVPGLGDFGDRYFGT